MICVKTMTQFPPRFALPFSPAGAGQGACGIVQVRSIPIRWTSDLPIYASEAFLRLVGRDYGWLGGYDAQDRLCCLLPYTLLRKGCLRMARFRVETIPVGKEIDPQTEKLFLDKVVEHLRSARVDLIMPASTNTVFRVYPSGAKAAPYGSYVVDLSRPEHELWANLHGKHRNVIRNAKKQGVVIRDGSKQVGVIHRMIEETLGRSGLGFQRFPEFLRFVEGLGNQVKLFVAVHDDAVQGCAVVPYSMHSAYYLYGGSRSEPLTGALNLLQWEAMQFFRALGVQRYDFVGVRIDPERGSKQDRLRMFKERFGGTLRQGYIWKYVYRLLPCLLYSAAIRLMRGGDIVDLESHKLANRAQAVLSRA